MHFLLTNDDGISSPGLRALSDAALARGHSVVVCAPQTQQSATSHHITLSAPLLVRETPWPGTKAYAIAGTPADCVRLAPLLTQQPIDFAFSGINDGENAGTAVYYSGTVSAAREARMLNFKSMAVSLSRPCTPDMLAHLALRAVTLAERLASIPLPRLCLVNLNAPSLPPESLKPLRIAPLSDAYYLDSYEKRVNPRGDMYFWLESGLKIEEHKPDTDMALLSQGHPTLTLLGGLTDANALLNEYLQDLLA